MHAQLLHDLFGASHCIFASSNLPMGLTGDDIKVYAVSVAPVLYGLASKSSGRIEPKAFRISEVLNPSLLQIMNALLRVWRLPGALSDHAGGSVTRSLINDQHEIHMLLSFRMDPVSNVGTDRCKLRGKRLKGS